MDLASLIAALSRPEAYPHPAGEVEVRQTHISVVFLAGDCAYKVKKPVALGFLNFSTLDRRRHFCEEEVRLNRRLAPEVYLGVVPVTRAGEALRFGGEGEPVEWAVRMQRLPAEATLQKRLGRGEVTAAVVGELARRVASFHKAADGGRDVHGYGGFESVARNARENFTQTAPHVGTTISRAVHERLAALTEERLAALRPLIEGRARRGVPRDTHGDLHLDHVYLFPDRPPPGDLVVVDCIEFNERFRVADPVADMAFLAMDLKFHGRRDLADAFADAYFAAAGDDEGRALLPFYAAYRAAVRGKVEGMKAAEAEVPGPDREKALASARGHWLLALGELEGPGGRPCLVLTAGLPGSGKSTLARSLAREAGFEVIRSDVVRKELGPPPGRAYSPEWTARTYAECLRRAEELLFEGRRVLIDANFRREAQRLPFLEAAARWRVSFLALLCHVSPEEARARLSRRQGDASDADWSVYQQLAAEWEAPGEATHPFCRDVPSDGTPAQTLETAAAALRGEGLLA